MPLPVKRKYSIFKNSGVIFNTFRWNDCGHWGRYHRNFKYVTLWWPETWNVKRKASRLRIQYKIRHRYDFTPVCLHKTGVLENSLCWKCEGQVGAFLERNNQSSTGVAAYTCAINSTLPPGGQVLFTHDIQAGICSCSNRIYFSCQKHPA